MKTYKIQVLGMVQGIGFRPFVAELAERLGVMGTVRNDGGIVTITCQVEKQEELDRFIELLRFDAPKAAYIGEIRVSQSEERMNYRKFEILDSREEIKGLPMLPPDLGMCPECRAELLNPSNKRFRYPFISCAICGPRYSIMRTLPYDRDTTTMDAFQMCPECEAEYTKQGDRRRHAQTISCHDCGPQLFFYRRPTEEEQPSKAGLILQAEKEPAVLACIEALKTGKILALKGVGGYQLCCMPTRQDTVATLRMVKGREEKPFAVMFADIDAIRAYASVSEEEERELCSLAAPIVLLEKSRHGKSNEFAENVLQGSQHIGAFLPYTGLHRLLCDACGPLIMTSANRSGSPILYRDEEMMAFAKENPQVYGIATQTREILTPLDDSVLRMQGDHVVFLRRSRGYVPLPLILKQNLPVTRGEDVFLCVGGDLKSTAAIGTKDCITETQYFGDLEDAGVADSFLQGTQRLEQLLEAKPTKLVCDLHPGYISTSLAEEKAKEKGLPLLYCQHHKAHIASVMAEHGLTACLGVALDGTGFGLDGGIWGGEFFVADGSQIERVGHLSYVQQIGGNTAAKEAKLMALCHALEMEERFGEKVRDIPRIKALTDSLLSEKALYQGARKSGVQVVKSSSTGRLFDSVCAFLGLEERNAYEGFCATRLEKAASNAYHLLSEDKTGVMKRKMQDDLQKCRFPIFVDEKDGSPQLCLDQEGFLKEYLSLPYEAEYMALLFHYALADGILELCGKLAENTGIQSVALSGGVWANMLLWSRVNAGLKAMHLQIFTNEKYPCGDGGIALGQAYMGLMGWEDKRSEDL